MRAVIQRSKQASVKIDNKVISTIDKGLVVFVAIKVDDTQKDIEYIAKKIAGIRIFEDEAGKMNNDIKSINGQILAVSNFTLYGDMSHGYRPGFTESMMPPRAEDMYNQFIEELKKYNIEVVTGRFGADMQVSIINDGPVTIIIDSKR